MFVSMTIFGHGQTGEIGGKIAAEKFERLQPSAVAIAELAISARVASNLGGETEDAREWLDSIAHGVKAELDAPKFAREDILASQKELIERYFNRRVEALKKAVASHRAVVSAGTVIDEQIVRLLGRELNEHERAEARKAFEKAVDNVIGEAAKSTSPLLISLLGQGQAPQAARELIKELYKAEASEAAKTISGPIADIAFRPRSTSTVKANERLASIANRRTFNPDVLPREIVRPTAAEVGQRRSASLEVERVIRAAKR